ncbi:hypothetical protein [Paenibacillus pinistramenti]|uniref:hypothetical protein n=1 Tax=Paenibacillus pinistramenti TaxID=1768003 RepID=UPI001EF03A6E|nr:hypothetical protein [Paenibacillus pinistramenti]
MNISSDILNLAALVAAYVSVTRAFGLKEKWINVAAVLIAAIFVLVPDKIQEKLILISVIGLSATGAIHSQRKKKE